MCKGVSFQMWYKRLRQLNKFIITVRSLLYNNVQQRCGSFRTSLVNKKTLLPTSNRVLCSQHITEDGFNQTSMHKVMFPHA